MAKKKTISVEVVFNNSSYKAKNFMLSFDNGETYVTVYRENHPALYSELEKKFKRR